MNIFDYAPESADSLKQSVSDAGNLQWFKGLYVHIGDDKYAHTVSSRWKTIATRPLERKTIQDVLETYPDGWPESRATTAWELDGHIRFGHSITDKTICTREEYEKARGEKVEEWTHTRFDGDKCVILQDTPDVYGDIVIKTKTHGYALIRPENLKPIKPQITKAKAWDRLNETECTIHEFGNRLIELQDKYDIID